MPARAVEPLFLQVSLSSALSLFSGLIVSLAGDVAVSGEVEQRGGCLLPSCEELLSQLPVVVAPGKAWMLVEHIGKLLGPPP